jgi:hypothetical protein
MSDKTQIQSGGSLLAFSIIGGTLAGVIAGQPSIGFLGGTALGLVLLIIIWLKNRR